MCKIRTKITQKQKNLPVSHKLRTCEGGFAHCACEHNSPQKYAVESLTKAFGGPNTPQDNKIRIYLDCIPHAENYGDFPMFEMQGKCRRQG